MQTRQANDQPAPPHADGRAQTRQCTGCRYDLTGVPVRNRTIICPECAHRHFTVVPPRSIYHCTCGTELTGQPLQPDGYAQCPSCERRWDFRFLLGRSLHTKNNPVWIIVLLTGLAFLALAFVVGLMFSVA